MNRKQVKTGVRTRVSPASATKGVLAAAFVALASVASGEQYDAQGGYVTLLAANSGNNGESTFVTNIARSSYGWSDGRDPHSGTNYYCGWQLCTPKVGNSAYEFKGDKLVLAAGLRFLADGQTIKIDDLSLLGNGFFQTAKIPNSITLDGSITVMATSGSPAYFQNGPSSQHYIIRAALKGASDAWLYISSDSQVNSQYVELDDADEYAGMLEVRESGLRLKLFSDMAGTMAITNGAILEIGPRCTTLGSVVLADGAILDLSAGGCINVTNSCSVGASIKIKGYSGATGERPLLSAPEGACTLDADAFTFFSPGVWRLRVGTANGVQTLYGECVGMPSYSEDAGFVKRVGNAINPFDLASEWSDGRTPHPDTNYCTYSVIALTTNAVFQGRSLTISGYGYLRTVDTRVTIGDLRVDSGIGNTTAYFTTAGSSSGRTYLSGSMTVISRITDTWPFSFFGSARDGQTWVSDQTIFGDEESALLVRGHFASQPGSVNNYVELVGDLTGFQGTLIVQTNETVRLGNSAFPGTVRLDTPYSRLSTLAASNAVVKIGALQTQSGATVEIPGSNSLHAATVQIAGTLVKRGGGVFGTSSVKTGESGILRVAEGGFMPLAPDAAENSRLTFADDTAIVFDVRSGETEPNAGVVDFTTTTVTAEGRVEMWVRTDNLASLSECALCLMTEGQIAQIEPSLSVWAYDGVATRRGCVSIAARGSDFVVIGDFRPLGMMMILR